jgi:hypothetical protein
VQSLPAIRVDRERAVVVEHCMVIVQAEQGPRLQADGMRA